MNSRERCLAVMKKEKPDRVPFFPLLMFLAADRTGVDYTTYITSPIALAEAQQHMHEQYLVDAVTACSDSYLISSDLGAEVVFCGDQTPHLARPLISTKEDFDRLVQRYCGTMSGIGGAHHDFDRAFIDMDSPKSRCRQRIDAVGLMHRNFGDEAFVCGWVEMPFAEVCEWFGLTEFMYLMMDEPEFAHDVLEFATRLEIQFALRQLEAGADMVGCGDAASSLVSPAFFKEFALPYEQKVNAAIRSAGGYSKLHICGNSEHNFELMAQSGADLINIDYAVDLRHAAEVFTKAGMAVKGNADPVRDIMNVSPEEAWACGRRMTESMTAYSYMLSPGCEIPAAASDGNLLSFSAAVLE